MQVVGMRALLGEEVPDSSCELGGTVTGITAHEVGYIYKELEDSGGRHTMYTAVADISGDEVMRTKAP